MIALEFKSAEENKKIINALLQVPGTSPAIFTDWFLFAPRSLRIVPPLIISNEEIKKACNSIITCLNKL